jgi:hypothetical protein
MQLYRERDVPANEHDRIFCYSRARAAIVYALLFGGAIALFANGVRQHFVPLELFGLIVAGGVVLAKRFVVARFRPSNWLVRATESGVYVKFRSYLNYHFSADDLTVAFIPYREITAARLVRETVEKFDLSTRIDGSRSNRTASYQRRKTAELELSCDTTALGAALLEEDARLGPSEKRWYGSTSTRANHHPVMLEKSTRLRIVWECVPPVGRFIAVLSSHVKVDATGVRIWSNQDVQELDRPALERRIAELARAGKMREARLQTRLHFAYDEDQTRQFIERLLRQGEGVASMRRETA